MSSAGPNAGAQLRAITGAVHSGWPPDRHVSMGVLVAPDVVIVPLEALGPSGPPPRGSPFGFAPFGASDVTEAALAAIDRGNRVVALRLALPVVERERLLPRAGDHAQVSRAVLDTIGEGPRAGETQLIRVRVAGHDDQLAMPVLGIVPELSEHDADALSFVGAPVASDGRLYGIVREQTPGAEPELGAVALAYVLRGSVGELLSGRPGDEDPQAPAPELPLSGRLSSGVREGLRLAHALGTSRAPSSDTTVDIDDALLLLGRLLSASTPVPHPSAAGFVLDAIAEQLGSDAEAARQRLLEAAGVEWVTTPPSEESWRDAVGSEAAHTLRAAVLLSEATTATGTVHSRHVLGALLSADATRAGSSVDRLLAGVKVDVAALRAAYLDFVLRSFPADSADAWRSALGPAAATEAPAPDEPGASLSVTLAGYVSEQEVRRDALDIRSDVNALCSIIAARNVKPPLAIGLFGDWGSGKSFFMERMERRLGLLARAANAAARRGQDDVAFCRKIVQVRFNAWHYMDQNLWASMVQRVFDGLAEAIGPAPASADSSRETLFARLDSTRRLLEDAERRLAAARTLADQTREHAAELEARRAKLSEAEAESRRVLEAALNSPAARERAEVALRALGRPGAAFAMTELLAQIRAYRDLWPRVKRAVVWIAEPDASGRRRRLWMTLLWLLPLATLSGLVAWLSLVPKPWVAAALSVLPLLVGVLARVGTATRFITGAVERLEDAQRELERVQLDAEARRLQEIKAHEEAQARLAREELDARVARDAAQRQLEEVEREIEEIRAGRRLYRYIEERARSDDYRKLQGVIAMVRADFEQLSRLLGEAVRAAEPGDVDPIERIVLYIDDLDRCPEERVIEVLQAVHLILAFDLFVVVVGVDSRWLLHALQTQYAAFLRPADELGLTREEIAHWATSPQNYLEKIFQIPFTLRPMTRDGYQRLVRDLVRPLRPSGRRRPRAGSSQKLLQPGGASGVGIRTDVVVETRGEQRRDGERRADAAGERQYDRRGDDRRAPAPTGSAAPAEEHAQSLQAEPPRRADAHDDPDDAGERGIEVLGDDLELLEEEVAFMLALDRLIPSPRAAKRFVNVYRLFRAGVADRGELPTLLGGSSNGAEPPYKAVLLLLAMLTGYPSQAPDIFRALERAADHEPWWLFVRGVAHGEIERFDALTTAEWSTPLAVDNTMWRVLDARLASLEEKLGYWEVVAGFREWAPRVARYSFHSGRVTAWDHGAGRISRPMAPVTGPMAPA